MLVGIVLTVFALGPNRAGSAQAAGDLGLPFVGLYLISTNQGQASWAAQRAATARAGFATVQVAWRDLEPTQNGQLDPTARNNLRAAVAAVAAQGLTPVAKVGWAPSWAADNAAGPLKEGKTAAYLTFLDNVVADLSQSPYGVRHWMLWPEADAMRSPPSTGQNEGRGGWGDDGQAFGYMIKDASARIKAVDPAAKVIVGPIAYDGFSSTSSPGFNDGGIFMYKFLDDVLTVPGAADAIDAVGINYYPVFGGGWETSPDAGSGVDVAAKINFLRARLAARGIDKPIVVGETAFWSSGDSYRTNERAGGDNSDDWIVAASQEAQTAYVAKVLARARDAGAAGVNWFTLQDNPGLDKSYGLIDATGAEKSAFAAFTFVAQTLGGASRKVDPSASLTTRSGRVESYAFVGGGRQVVVAWATGSASASAQVSVAPGLQGYSISGASLTAVGLDGGRAVYDLSTTPALFVSSRYTVFAPFLPRTSN